MICPDCGNYRHAGECQGEPIIGYDNSGEEIEVLCDKCGDPATVREGNSNTYCGQCAPRTMPSREFLIRQAVLNWVVTAYGALLPYRSAASIISQISLGGTMLEGTPRVVQGIRDEFEQLTMRFS